VIQNILCQDIIDVVELKKVSWQGLECPLTRAQIWRLILGYESPIKQNRSEDLKTKRLEYIEKLKSLHVSFRKVKPSKHILNSFPKSELFKNKVVQNSLRQIITLILKDDKLKKKSTPAMIIPFFIVFLSEFYPVDLETLEVRDEGPQKFYMSIVEADTYWCASIFLTTYYNKKKAQLCENVIKALEKFDSAVLFHMNFERIRMSFLNRWVKYLFLKDFPLHVCLRIFDELITNKNSKVYITKCNNDALQNNFIVCLACALFSIFRNQILISSGSNLEDIMARLPTDSWREIEILILVSQAYLYQSILD
jgi:Rab-GTPase-TBC domain